MAAQTPMFQSLNAATGLIGWWKLCGDTSSSNGCMASSATAVYDSSGVGNPGTWSGTPAGSTGYYSAGRLGPWAGYFNGSNNNIGFGSPSTLNFSGATAFSVSAWVMLPANNAVSWPLMVTTVNNQIQMGLQNTTNYPYITYHGNGAQQVVWSPTAMATGLWYFLAGTFNGSVEVLYINGAPVGSVAVSYPIQDGITSNFIVGYDSAFGTRFKGYINDLRLYNRALSASEIAGMYLAHN
jgi:hypothetical protein